jgi:hypothetical protein
VSGSAASGGGDDISEERQPFITLFLRLEAAGLIDGKVALLERHTFAIRLYSLVPSQITRTIAGECVTVISPCDMQKN